MKLLLLLIFTELITGRGENEGNFWMITDLHYDFTYGLNSDAESCRHVIPFKQLGKYGDYDCDTPWIMLNETIYNMKKIAPNVDFIIWTGDSVMHTRRPENLVLNETVNIDTVRKITNLITDAFPDVPLIPTVGNHDFFPDAQTSASMLDDFANVWFNESGLYTMFRKGGYYSVKVAPKLRLINLNTILYYKRNKIVNPTTDLDPAGQFDWLEKELHSSRNENKKVFITGHIPPGLLPNGKSWFPANYNERFIQIIQEYADVINAMFFGHDHATIFKIITSNGKGSVPVLIAPSVTPWTYKYNHNPAMWLVTYDRQLATPVRIDQYYSDLLQANRLQKLDYVLSNSLPGVYKMDNISGESLLDLRERMKSDDRLFRLYMKFMYANVTTDKQPEINLDLKISILCAMSNMDRTSYGTCKAHGIKLENNAFKTAISMTTLLNAFIIALISLDLLIFC